MRNRVADGACTGEIFRSFERAARSAKVMPQRPLL